MSRVRRRRRSWRAHLTYANATATLALFLALGGGAYAATALPRHSVGRDQLRSDAVTRSKLADGAVGTSALAHDAVTLNRLSKGVRYRLDRTGATGATGPKGEPGATGASGSSAAGAREVRFDAAGAASPAPATVLDLPGLTLKAACVRTGADTALSLRVDVPEATTLQSTFTLDTGSDPANPPQPGDPGVLTGNGQSKLVAGVDNDLGGPGTQGGTGYFRGIAHAVLVSASRTITLELFELVDAGTGRCQIGGTALPAG